MISVVVIGKNEGERLAACLKSIQTALNVLAHEVVYVDSCSTDQSLQTAKALGARCFLLAERQTTAGLGRFVGAKEARGEYLLFLDSDDFFESELMEHSLNKIKEDQADVCMYDARLYFGDTGKYRKSMKRRWRKQPVLMEFNGCGKKMKGRE